MSLDMDGRIHLRHAWAVSTNHPQYWDYFREPLWTTRRCLGICFARLWTVLVYLYLLMSIQGILFFVAHTITNLCRASTKSISIAIGLIVTALSLPYTSLWSNGYPLSTLGFAILMNTSICYSKSIVVQLCCFVFGNGLCSLYRFETLGFFTSACSCNWWFILS